ncbi:sugar transporter [Sphingomonas naphthae]|uniref:Sugar transporter n=1 Tax=Sphingomonas naphthae TaxID=1813468 RepID=A0ABY7TM75_9SPHN|nr:sugar transporter [Sphingomonas naphthae]WCT74108.1 sugar transporter [Sphingomonas naphthae]
MAAWSNAPRSHIVISIILILWGLAGLASFVNEMLMTPERLAALPIAQQEMWTSMPGWLWYVFALAVASGFGGAVALLLRRRSALPLFVLSLAAIVVQFGYTLFVMDAIGKMGLVEAAAFPAVIFLIGVFQVYYARAAAKKGLLR